MKKGCNKAKVGLYWSKPYRAAWQKRQKALGRAYDFFCKIVWTLRGKSQAYVLLFIHQDHNPPFEGWNDLDE